MCAYRVYQSSSLENFIHNYSDVLTPDALFGRSLYLVVQNKSMGEWLKLQLAEKRGISADNPYVLPEKALRELADGYPCIRSSLGTGETARPVLYMDNLKIRLFKILESMFSGNSPVHPSCSELYEYVTGYTPRDERNRMPIRSGRLYELSDSIAGLFSHYGMNSLPLVESWESGCPYEGVPGRLKKHEEWQRYLWGKVYDSGVSFSKILRIVEDSTDVYDGEASRIVLFGSSFLGETAIRFFHRLSRDIDVDHFILTPSKAYQSSPPEIRNPLLVSWCTQMDGFANLADSFALEDRHHDYPVPGGDTLLSLIQADILENRMPPGEHLTNPLSDGSLAIHGFTSPWREVEVLKDLLLDALNRDPGLRLTDIAVLSPDINRYAPFIEVLFPSEVPGLHLPFNLIDLNSSEMSPLIQGFLHMFSLPGGEFSRTDLFVLFDNPCFRESLGTGRQERDSWLQLCDDLNIKWGYDRTHKSFFYKDTSDFNSWTRGFDRIAEGLFLEEEDSETLPFESPDEETGRTWGILMQTMENLYNDLFELDRVSMPLEQWILLAESVLEVYLKPRRDNRDDEQDRFRLKGCFRDMLNLAVETPVPGDRKFDFFVFRTLLTEFIRKSSGVKGRYLTQGITCSSLKPMRAIPFKRIYILGMNEADFPGQDEILSFDLKETVPQTIDLSRSGGDKYSFLETLLSASENLTLFFRNRDSLRGEVLQPSIVVSELTDYLNRRFDFPEGTDASSLLISEESIHNFDPRYFDGSRGYLSFNEAALKTAVLQLNSRTEERKSLRLSRISQAAEEELEEVSLPVEEILSFLKNPGAWYFKRVLKISAEDEDSREQDRRENRELDYLERYGYLEERLKSPAELGDPEVLERYLREQQLRGNLPDSDILFLEKERLSQRLEEMRTQGESRDLVKETEGLFDLIIDPERHSGWRRRSSLLPVQSVPSLKRVLESGAISLCGTLESLCLSETPGVWRNLEFCDAGTPVVRHSLRGALHFMVLSCLQEDMEQLELIRIGKRDYPRITFSASGESEACRVVFDRPADRLDRIISLCLDSGRDTVPLYPVLGEALAVELLERPQMSDSELKELWIRQWLTEASNSRGTQTFHRCRYRLEYMKTPPEADPYTLRELLELLYIPLLSSVKKGGGRG